MKAQSTKNAEAAELYHGFVCLAVKDAFDVWTHATVGIELNLAGARSRARDAGTRGKHPKSDARALMCSQELHACDSESLIILRCLIRVKVVQKSQSGDARM